MATLLDTLKKNLGGVGAPAEPIADETGTVQRLLAAKKGIVGGPQAPKGLNIAEAAARGQTQQQLQQVGEQAQLQSTAIQQAATGQAEEQKQREQAIEGQREEGALRNRIQTENILRGLEQSGREMDEKERQSQIELAGAMLRFQNGQYIRDLQREGAKARITDANEFDRQLLESILGENRALLKAKIGSQELRDLNDRDFNKEIAKIDIDTALQFARENAKQMQTQAQIQGATELAKSAVSAYGQYKGGAFSGDYQSYADAQRAAGRTPVSFTTWQQSELNTSGNFTGPTRAQAGR